MQHFQGLFINYSYRTVRSFVYLKKVKEVCRLLMFHGTVLQFCNNMPALFFPGVSSSTVSLEIYLRY